MDNPAANTHTNGQRKKCHGNRRRRLFRQRCRKRGMTEEAILAAIYQYEVKKSSTSTIHRSGLIDNNTHDSHTDTERRAENMETTMNSQLSMKRKQIAVSIISLSTASIPKKKKSKKKKARTKAATTNEPKYPLSKYLRTLSYTLLQGLCLQLKTDLKKKCHQQFIYKRLKLFDQKYRLDIHRNQWQSYLEIGSNEQCWPVSDFFFYKIT